MTTQTTADELTPMSQIQMVRLHDIQPNPYQPRQQEDPAVIAEIALSIYRQGLMQIPVARPVNGHYQLAFGHTRHAAYELLLNSGLPEQGILGDDRFAHMPLHVRELDDRQMFEMAAAENIKRRDLNPIEQAVSMKRYMEEFQASSREAAELFGVSDVTVRGTVRLLRLPESVQTKIASGEITQGAARKLLSLPRLKEAEVEQISKRIAEGSSADEAIQFSLDRNSDVLTLWGRYEAGEAHAGRGLWPLDTPADKFPSAYLPELTVKDVAKSLGVERNDITDFRGALKARDVADLAAEFPNNVDLIERTAHLQSPPACDACPFHAVVSREHLCGLKACHSRKKAAWLGAEWARACKRLGIPAYDKASDGGWVMLAENRWEVEGDRGKEKRQLFKGKDSSLRLMLKPENYSEHPFTKSKNVCVVIVGEKAEASIAERKANKPAPYDHAAAQAKWEAERRRRDAAEKFVKTQALPQFAGVFASAQKINLHALSAFLDIQIKETNKAHAMAHLQMRMADVALRNNLDWKVWERGPVGVAKAIEKIAVTWGVKLPADFLEIAKQYEPGQPEPEQGVSTETPKRKGKKNANP